MKKIFFSLFVTTFIFCSSILNAQSVPHLVVSQIYGGGGNSGATYTNDFVELFNPTNSTINISGWSVQYQTAAGSTWTSVASLTGSIAAGKYYLIQLASGGAVGSPLPIPDLSPASPTNIAATAGKIALVNSTTLLPNCIDASIVDKVGYGTTSTVCNETTNAAAPSNTTSILRKNNGCTDTDNNSSDFVTGTPNPRNNATIANICNIASVSISSGTNASEPSINGSFTINFNTPTVASTTFDYSFSGSAGFASDYNNATLSTGSPSPLTVSIGTINVPSGTTSLTITITPINDATAESTETIVLTISNPSNGYVVGTGSATINLLDDDFTPISLNGSYSQDFNSLLVNSGTGSVNTLLPNGWGFLETGTNANTTYSAGTGSSNAGDTYSFGSGTLPSDRAFGSVLSGSLNSRIGASFVNNTGTTISALKIIYTGEQWRLGATGRNDKMDFQYSADASNLSTGTWTDVNQLDFIAPNSTGTVGAFDGNLNSNHTTITYSIVGLSISDGSTFFIRWVDADASGSDDGLGVDDFSIEANPTDPYPPIITSLFPANNATNVSTNLTASISFDETVQKGTGNIVIKKASDGSVVQTIDVNNAAVTVSTTKVLFNLSGLEVNTGYYIEVDNGAFKDLANNNFAGISGNGTWAFTTGIIFYTADFQTCSPSLSDGFTQYSEIGAITWGCTIFGIDAAHTPTGSAANGVQINGFSGGTNVPNVDWLISPSFNLTTTTYPLLSFWSRTAFNGLPLQLKVSTDYVSGNPASATWTDINGKFPSQTSNIWTVSSNINLSAFKQSNVHFAFVYTSSDEDGARWTLDDINIDNSPVPPAPSLTVSTNDIQFSYTASGSTTDKTFTFIGNDLTEDVTLNSTGAFLLSKDGISFSSSLTYSVDEANNLTKTVYTRFAPTQNNQNFTGSITVSTSGISANINLKGTSIDPETTLEVVNWNMEWFGSTTLGPTNDDQQEQNAEIILKNIGADVFGLVEVVDETRLARIVSHMPGYSYVICDYGSHTNPFESGASPLSEAQKEAFVYKTSLFSNISTTPLVTAGVNTAADLSNPAYNYFASGRYPYMMKADVTLNRVTKTIRFVLLHAKANTSPTVTSYNRRKAGADTLKFTLNNLYPNDNILMLGDFNDDLDSTITDGINPRISSYYVFTNDTVTTFSSPTLALSLAGKKSTVSYNDVIDHVMLSNEMLPYYMSATANILTDVASLVSNYGSTTTDHYPVFTRYMFCKLTCPENIVVSNDAGQCGAVINFNVSSTMTCGTVTAVPASGSFFPVGITTVHVTAGTGDTCSFTVTVNDEESPAITAPDFVAVNADPGQCSTAKTNIDLSTPTYSDNCEGSTVNNDAPDVFAVGITVVTWTVTDAHGHTATASQIVTVTDNQDPTITAPGDIIINNDHSKCYATIEDLGTPATNDNCEVQNVINDVPQNNQFSIGNTIVTWTVTDIHGNTATATQTITVSDNENPTINCPGNQIRNTNANQCSYTTIGTEFDATANDNCSGMIITNDYNNSNTLAGAVFDKGQTTITWTATDAVGNTATCSFKITIEDHQAPVITAPANITVNTDAGVCYATNVSLGTATTSDNCPGETKNNNSLSQFPKGNTTVIWTATDASGNTNTAAQTVTVVDNEKPVITYCPVVPVLCYNIGGNYTIPVITATDNCGSITYSYVITGTTNRSGNINNASGAFNVGTNTITWTAKDDSNNSSTCQTTVIVNPSITASVADVYAVNPGGAANTIYIGYGPTSVTLNAPVSGGTTPYSYKWTIGSSAGSALNNTSSYTVSPAAATTYYFNVKDVYGCSAPLVTKTINVVDVRCGAKMDKVTICQLIKGKYNTNCLATKDVSSALSSGSYLGACSNAVIVTKANKQVIVESTALIVTAMPNPSVNYFTISIKGGNALEKMKLKVTDVLGRSIEKKDNIQTNSTIKIGNGYFPGVYIVEIIQGINRKQIKLIKAGN
jgi:hypothetical protein